MFIYTVYTVHLISIIYIYIYIDINSTLPGRLTLSFRQGLPQVDVPWVGNTNIWKLRRRGPWPANSPPWPRHWCWKTSGGNDWNTNCLMDENIGLLTRAWQNIWNTQLVLVPLCVWGGLLKFWILVGSALLLFFLPPAVIVINLFMSTDANQFARAHMSNGRCFS